MDRLKRNPGAWGLVLGAAVAAVAMLLTWIEVTNSAGASEQYRAIETVTGKSLFGLAILTVLSGVGVIASQAGGRFVWASLGLLGGGMLLAASVVAIADPAGFTTFAVKSEAVTKLMSGPAIQQSGESVQAAFADGLLTASAQLGAVVGLVGASLATLGALLSFRRPVASTDS
jgi:energy-coupling factor transporter transmembrane protein EcfT